MPEQPNCRCLLCPVHPVDPRSSGCREGEEIPAPGKGMSGWGAGDGLVGKGDRAGGERDIQKLREGDGLREEGRD